jgi:hypothetical protein
MIIIKSVTTGMFEWFRRITSMDTAWVTVVVTDDDLSEKRGVWEK